MAGELNQLLKALVDALGGEANSQSDLVQRAAQGDADASANSDDDLYDQAVAVVNAHQRASISLVQRHLRIGYSRAARLLESMEKNGLVSAMRPDGLREILKAA